MNKPLPSFFLAKGESGPGIGLLEGPGERKAVVLFTDRERADAYYRDAGLAEPWIVNCASLFVFGKWLDENHNRGVRFAIVNPDAKTGKGDVVDVFDLLSELEARAR